MQQAISLLDFYKARDALVKANVPKYLAIVDPKWTVEDVVNILTNF